MENETKPKVSKKQQAHVNKYIAKAYDRVTIVVPKGRKDEIKARAESQGESVNGYIWRLIQEDMQQGD